MQDLNTRVGTILNGAASGMIPMAIFTPVYAIWPVFAWPVAGSVFFVLALAWSAYLAVIARGTLRLGRELPHERNEYDARITKGMAIVSSLQGVLILASVIVLALLGLLVWVLPVVALIVALHFFPMPVIFGRTIDYYLGTAMLAVAVVGLALAGQAADWQLVWAITGIGGALVTSSYGLYIVLTARRTLSQYRRVTRPNEHLKGSAPSTRTHMPDNLGR